VRRACEAARRRALPAPLRTLPPPPPLFAKCARFSPPQQEHAVVLLDVGPHMHHRLDDAAQPLLNWVQSKARGRDGI